MKNKVKWPVCTLIILAVLGGPAYWGYTAFKAEQAMLKAERTPAQSAQGPSNQGMGPLSPAPQGIKAGEAAPWRAAFPLSFLIGFALVMAVILGSIIYFWWSLKELEGGRRYGEEEETGGEEEAADAQNPL